MSEKPILTNENYFEDTFYMSVSSFKKFRKCEVDGLLPFESKSDSMMVGSYVDAYIEGTLEQFKLDYPEVFTTKIAENENTIELLKAIDGQYVTRNNTLNSAKLSEAKKLYPQCFTVTSELKAPYKKAEEICSFIDNDERFSQFMSGEKQTIMTGEIAGVPFKIKMDSYSHHIAINDLKVMYTVTDKNGNFYDFISQWGYDLQLSAYQEIVYQNTGERLPCYVCAVTKESPINSVIVNLPQYVLDKAFYTLESEVKRYYDIKTGKEEPIGCGKCKSCISNRKVTPIISMEEFADFM